MTMKKTLILFLLALLAAPLWGQRTYGELSTDELRQAANNGDANAQAVLGDRYYEGDRAPQDYKQAVHWYTKAANQGNAGAQCNLGVCYDNGDGVAQDFKQAVYWYTKAANQGNANAQCNLGVCYYNGEGVAQDYKQAVYWYTKAANQGDDVAQYKLGLCYFGGNGTARDWQQAVSWFTKAANQGYANAQYCLGVCFASGRGVGNDSQQALAWFKKAKQNGFTCNDTTHYFFIPEDLKFEVGVTEAGLAKGIFVSYDLNRWYKRGLIYCWLDDEIRVGEKVEAIRKAANQGNAKGQFEMGAMYHHSNLVLVHDMKQAVYWYTKSANQGYARAQDTLGDCYYNGDGVEKNLKQATNWYTKAARQGNASAQFKLASRSNLEGLDDKQRLYWCTQAANRGHADALGSLPYYFFRSKDYKQAIAWAKKAKKDHHGHSFNDFIEACEKIIHASQTKDAKAQYDIGLGFRDGKIGKYKLNADYKEAVYWFNLSANQGNADAILRLAECYERGNGVEKNVGKAISLYQKVANQGNRVDAMFLLAQCYEKEGYMDDALLLNAMINANPDAHPFYKSEANKAKERILGRHSSNTASGTTNSTAARSQRTDTSAPKPATTPAKNTTTTSSSTPKKDTGMEFDENLRVTQRGNTPPAPAPSAAELYSRGEAYFNGDGVEHSPEKAVELWTQSAEKGYTIAQLMLAECYKDGIGAKKDLRKAFEWYSKAASGGNANAQGEVALAYFHGNGVQADLSKAEMWAKKAWAQRSKMHDVLRGDVERLIKTDLPARKKQQSASRQQSSSTNKNQTGGNTQAKPRAISDDPSTAADQYELATRYHRGTAGKRKDTKKAIHWYTRAANQGSPEAMLELGRIYYYGSSVDKDPDEALYWLQKIEFRQQSQQATHSGLVKEAMELLGRIRQGK